MAGRLLFVRRKPKTISSGRCGAGTAEEGRQSEPELQLGAFAVVGRYSSAASVNNCGPRSRAVGRSGTRARRAHRENSLSYRSASSAKVSRTCAGSRSPPFGRAASRACHSSTSGTSAAGGACAVQRSAASRASTCGEGVQVSSSQADPSDLGRPYRCQEKREH